MRVYTCAYVGSSGSINDDCSDSSESEILFGVKVLSVDAGWDKHYQHSSIIIYELPGPSVPAFQDRISVAISSKEFYTNMARHSTVRDLWILNIYTSRHVPDNRY